MSRKYTVHEINRMRECIRWSYPSMTPYYENERAAEIELRLQTYMLNETAPEELEKLFSERVSLEKQTHDR